jgi:hypothetical protein
MELSSIRNNGSNLDVSSISKSLEELNLPLRQCLDDKSIWFLTACGVNWRKDPYYLPIIWSVVVLLVVFTFYVILGLFDVISLGIETGEFTVYLLLDLGLTLQGIAAIFIIVHTRERMHQIANKIDLFVFPASRWVALNMFACFLRNLFSSSHLFECSPFPCRKYTARDISCFRGFKQFRDFGC